MTKFVRYCSLVVLIPSGYAGAQPQLKDIGASSWGEDVYGWRMNSAGTIVVGQAGDPGAWRAFRWSADSGEIEDLGFLPGHDESVAWGVSEDGRVVVGESHSDSSWNAFRWTPELGMQELPAPPGWKSSGARNVSGDGRTIVGGVTDGNSPVACRWVDDGKPELLGVLPGHSRSFALGISNDGRVVTGWSGDPGGESIGFLWSEDSGMIALVPPLGSAFSAGGTISDDGSTITGHINFDAAWWRADTGWQYVFLNSNGPWQTSLSFGNGLTATGNTVVGAVLDHVNGNYAFYWREDTGYLFLRSSTLGIPYGSWNLTDATDISPEGTAVLARGYFANATRTCVITGLPRVDGLCLPDFTDDSVLDIADVQIFLDRYSIGSTEADFVRDGSIDFFDLQDFLNRFAAGCP